MKARLTLTLVGAAFAAATVGAGLAVTSGGATTPTAAPTVSAPLRSVELPPVATPTTTTTTAPAPALIEAPATTPAATAPVTSAPATVSAPALAPAPIPAQTDCTIAWTSFTPLANPDQPGSSTPANNSGWDQDACDEVSAIPATLPTGSTYGIAQGAVDPSTIVQNETVATSPAPVAPLPVNPGQCVLTISIPPTPAQVADQTGPQGYDETATMACASVPASEAAQPTGSTFTVTQVS